MPVTDITPDVEGRTLTVVADFAAPVDRVWQVYADPRQLEQVWGPPDYPATFLEHSLTPGGRMVYYMTSPEGEKYYGYWEVGDVEEPRRFDFADGFATDEAGTPAPELPVSRATMTFEATDGGTRLTTVSTYESAEAIQQVLDMGVVEGTAGAMNQIDALLAA